jgi:hypothetical protein
MNEWKNVKQRLRRRLSCGIWQYVLSKKLTDISEVPLKHHSISTRLHGALSQNSPHHTQCCEPETSANVDNMEASEFVLNHPHMWGEGIVQQFSNTVYRKSISLFFLWVTQKKTLWIAKEYICLDMRLNLKASPTKKDKNSMHNLPKAMKYVVCKIYQLTGTV